jgi:hypothetical protein
MISPFTSYMGLICCQATSTPPRFFTTEDTEKSTETQRTQRKETTKYILICLNPRHTKTEETTNSTNDFDVFVFLD